MRVALLSMILVGSSIGFLWPTGKRAAPIAANIAVTPSDPYVTPRETTLVRASNGHFYADAFVNRKTIHFVIDTGATDVALTEDDARMAGVSFDSTQFQVVGTGASGPVVGQEVTLNDVSLDGKRVTGVKGVVLQGLTVSLLGQNYLRQLHNVQISGDTMTLR